MHDRVDRVGDCSIEIGASKAADWGPCSLWLPVECGLVNTGQMRRNILPFRKNDRLSLKIRWSSILYADFLSSRVSWLSALHQLRSLQVDLLTEAIAGGMRLLDAVIVEMSSAIGTGETLGVGFAVVRVALHTGEQRLFPLFRWSTF